MAQYTETVKAEMGQHLVGKLTLLDADKFEKGILPQRYVVRQDLEKYRQYTDQQYSQAMSDAQKIWRFSFVLYGAVALFSLAFFGALRWVLLRALAQKRQAEEALHLSEEIARQSVDLTEIGIFNHNHVEQSVYCSPQLFHILGVKENDAFTIAKYFELIPENERQAVIASIDKSMDPNGSGKFQAEHRLIRKDGSVRWVTARGRTYFQKHMGRATPIRSIGAVLDITKRKEIEISLRKAMEDLAQEKIKLERSNYELNQFASIAAHDLRAPITSMLGWIGIIDKLIPKPREDKIVKAINFITFNAKKADALISDLLALARLNTETIKIEPVDLEKVFKNVVAVLKEPIDSANAKITHSPLPKINGCLSHFDSLLTNLIRNALTYRHNSRPPRIDISCQEHHNFYQFSVKDNGIGIAPQYKDRIFEMFKRLNSENECAGTGIGLSYCKKIVELHGGQIWVESTPDEGSTFYFTYPISDTTLKELA
jgi:PAS domain S-box-containing protein